MLNKYLMRILLLLGLLTLSNYSYAQGRVIKTIVKNVKEIQRIGKVPSKNVREWKEIFNLRKTPNISSSEKVLKEANFINTGKVVNVTENTKNVINETSRIAPVKIVTSEIKEASSTISKKSEIPSYFLNKKNAPLLQERELTNQEIESVKSLVRDMSNPKPDLIERGFSHVSSNLFQAEINLNENIVVKNYFSYTFSDGHMGFNSSEVNHFISRNPLFTDYPKIIENGFFDVSVYYMGKEYNFLDYIVSKYPNKEEYKLLREVFRGDFQSIRPLLEEHPQMFKLSPEEIETAIYALEHSKSVEFYKSAFLDESLELAMIYFKVPYVSEASLVFIVGEEKIPYLLAFSEKTKTAFGNIAKNEMIPEIKAFSLDHLNQLSEPARVKFKADKMKEIEFYVDKYIKENNNSWENLEEYLKKAESFANYDLSPAERSKFLESWNSVAKDTKLLNASQSKLFADTKEVKVLKSRTTGRKNNKQISELLGGTDKSFSNVEQELIQGLEEVKALEEAKSAGPSKIAKTLMKGEAMEDIVLSQPKIDIGDVSSLPKLRGWDKDSTITVKNYFVEIAETKYDGRPGFFDTNYTRHQKPFWPLYSQIVEDGLVDVTVKYKGKEYNFLDYLVSKYPEKAEYKLLRDGLRGETNNFKILFTKYPEMFDIPSSPLDLVNIKTTFLDAQDFQVYITLPGDWEKANLVIRTLQGNNMVEIYRGKFRERLIKEFTKVVEKEMIPEIKQSYINSLSGPALQEFKARKIKAIQTYLRNDHWYRCPDSSIERVRKAEISVGYDLNKQEMEQIKQWLENWYK